MDKITEHDLDNEADKAGSYDLALRRLGLSWRDVIRDDGTSLAEASGPKEPTVGPSVDLGERAINLTTALEEYQQSSDADTLIQGFMTNGDPEGDLDRTVVIQELHERSAESAFLRAFGSRALYEAGHDLRRDANEQINEFIKTNIDSDDKTSRDKLAASLSRYKK